MDVSPREAIAFGMLVWASWLDLRTRRVPNAQWYPFLGAAAAFLAWDAAHGVDRRLLTDLALAACVVVAARLMFEARLFGGADAKCLMVLAVLLPHADADAVLRYPPALSILLNASAAVVVLPVTFLLWNAARGDVRLPAMLLGVRMPIEAAQRQHVWPMQRAEAGAIRWRYWQRMRDGREEAYARLAQAGLQRVWVTPKVPFMVPLAIGLAAYVLWGDLLLVLLQRGLGPT